ncbi:MAG: type VII toxin-antitoxin system HepT family RNase toxin [Candidatus Binatia bacterium]
MGPLDREVVDRRLLRLEALVRRLERDAKASQEAYHADEDLQARVERRLQVAAQVCLDLANYVIARGDLEVPEEEENVFLVLERAGVVDRNLGVRLRALTRFRNILVHDYVAVDHAIVHRHLREGLSDFREFAGAIVRYLDRADE